MTSGHFVSDLAIVLGVGAATAVISRRLRQPSVLGYLAAGLIVGPYLPVPVFADAGRVHALSEFGVVLVMFAVGLELRIQKLLRVLPVSGVTGLVQVSFLSWCGFSLGGLFGWTPTASLFLGTSIAISSTMIVSAVFEDAPVSRAVREYVLGILVVQDVIAIALIAAMTAVAAGGEVSAGELASTVGILAAVLFAMVGIGLLVVPRIVRAVVALDSLETLVVATGGICFGFALLAQSLGYSVALGAFIAGVLVAESGEGEKIEHLMRPLKDVFAAVFFVSVGMTVDPRLAWEHMGASVVVAAVVITAQLLIVSTAGVLSGSGLKRSLTAGLALGQIGEFAFILGAIGMASEDANPALQPILVTVAVLTAFTTPLMVRASGRIVSLLDRATPDRVHSLLALYENWFEGARTADPLRRKTLVGRSIAAIVLDAAALLGLAIGVAVGWPWLTESLQAYALLGQRPSEVLVLGAGLLAALPLLIGLARTTHRLGELIADRLAPDNAPESLTVAMRGLLSAATQLLALAAVGFPVVAILRPFLAVPFALPLLMVVLLPMAGIVWRRIGTAHTHVVSGAEEVLQLLARQAIEVEDPEAAPTPLPPGLESLVRVSLPADAYAVGRTLAELDLHFSCGAAVLAIHRGPDADGHPGAGLTIPSGAERLTAADVLALAGTREATERARDILLRGPNAEAPTDTLAGGSVVSPAH